jgi:AcrR family transcriptional regulator
VNDDSVTEEKKRRGARRRARTRADILSAAREVFAERGYHDAGIAEIAERADIAVGTFYLHFHDKEEAFMTLLQEGFEESRARVMEAIAAQEPDGPTLPVVIQAVLQHAYEQRSLFRIALTGGKQVMAASPVQTAIAEIIAGVLENAHKEAALIGYDLPILTNLITGMITQGIAWWFDHDTPDPETMTNQLIRVLQHGLPAHVFASQP